MTLNLRFWFDEWINHDIMFFIAILYIGNKCSITGKTGFLVQQVPWMQVSKSRSLLLNVKAEAFVLAVFVGVYGFIRYWLYNNFQNREFISCLYHFLFSLIGNPYLFLQIWPNIFEIISSTQPFILEWRKRYKKQVSSFKMIGLWIWISSSFF